jgi:ankyrin repeat protein
LYQEQRLAKSKGEVVILYHLIANLASVGRIQEAKELLQRHKDDTQELSAEKNECLDKACVVVDNYSTPLDVRIKEISEILVKISNKPKFKYTNSDMLDNFQLLWDKSGFIDADAFSLYRLSEMVWNNKNLITKLINSIKGRGDKLSQLPPSLSTGLSPIARGLLICITLTRFLNPMLEIYRASYYIYDIGQDERFAIKCLENFICDLFYHKTMDNQQRAIATVVQELLQSPAFFKTEKQISAIAESSALFGLFDLLQLLLRKFGFSCSSKKEMLVAATFGGSLACVKYLYSAVLTELYPNQPDAGHRYSVNDLGFSLLGLAITYGRMDITRYLIEECRADINQLIHKNNHICTPLMLAINEGKKDEVNYLLQKGANVHFLEAGESRDLLQFAEVLGHYHIVKLMRGKLENSLGSESIRSARQLTDKEVERECFNFIPKITKALTHPEDLTEEIFCEQFPVYPGSLDNLSVKSWALLACRALLIASCKRNDPAQPYSHFNSFMALYFVSKEAGKESEFIQELSRQLEILPPSLKPYFKPVDKAILMDMPDVLVLLLDKLKQKLDTAATLEHIQYLTWGVSGCSKVIPIIVNQFGQEIDAIVVNQNTLAFACINLAFACVNACLSAKPQLDKIEYLLRRGANFNKAFDYKGKTTNLFGLALESTVDVVKIFMWYGADLQQPIGHQKLLPITLATLFGNADVVEFLINSGVDFITEDPCYAKTPLELVCGNKHKKEATRSDFPRTKAILIQASVEYYERLGDQYAADDQLKDALESYEKAITCQLKARIDQAKIDTLKRKQEAIQLKYLEEIISQINAVNREHITPHAWIIGQADQGKYCIQLKVDNPQNLHLMKRQLKKEQIDYELSKQEKEKLIKINVMTIDTNLLPSIIESTNKAAGKKKQSLEKRTKTPEMTQRLAPAIYKPDTTTNKNIPSEFIKLSDDERAKKWIEMLVRGFEERYKKITFKTRLLRPKVSAVREEQNQVIENNTCSYSSTVLPKIKNTGATEGVTTDLPLVNNNQDPRAVDNSDQLYNLNSNHTIASQTTMESDDRVVPDFIIDKKNEKDFDDEKCIKQKSKKKKKHKKQLTLPMVAEMDKQTIASKAALNCALEAADRMVINFLNEYKSDKGKLTEVDQRVRHYGILLGIICTFKALLKYAQLGGRSITADDKMASYLRNIIHYFDQIKVGDQDLDKVAYAIRDQLLPSIRHHLKGEEVTVTINLNRGSYAKLVAKLQPSIDMTSQYIFELLNRLSQCIQEFMKPFYQGIHQIIEKKNANLYVPRWDAIKICLAFIGETYNQLKRNFPTEVKRMTPALISFLERNVFKTRNPISHEVDDGDIYNLEIPCAFDEVDDVTLFKQVQELGDFESEFKSLAGSKNEKEYRSESIANSQINPVFDEFPNQLPVISIPTHQATTIPEQQQVLASCSNKSSKLNANAKPFISFFSTSSSPQSRQVTQAAIEMPSSSKYNSSSSL